MLLLLWAGLVSLTPSPELGFQYRACEARERRGTWRTALAHGLAEDHLPLHGIEEKHTT